MVYGMAKKSPRTNRKTRAPNYQPWVSHLVTFVFGALAGIIMSMVLGGNEPLPVNAGGVPPPTGTPSAGSAVINQLQTHLTHSPEDREARTQLANAYFDAGNYQSAIMQYAQVLETDPNNPDVIVDLGISYRRIGESDACIKRFRKALSIDPSHVNARYNLGLVLQSDALDFPGAIAAWDTLLMYTPNHPRAGWIREQMASMRNK